MISTRVFIGNLAWLTTEESVATFCSEAGEVVKVEVMRHDDTGRSKGWGIVEFSTSQDAQNAVSILNGKMLEDRNVHVRIDRSHERQTTGTNIYVGNIPWETTEEDLMELFQDFNPNECNILTNMYGRSRGFAIMNFDSLDVARDAMNHFSGYEIRGRPIECRIDRGPGRSDDSVRKTRVFVGNLESAVNDANLAATFAHIGAIVSAKISRHNDGRSKGWGIVVFETEEAAQAAVNSMDNQPIGSPTGAPARVRIDKK